MFFASRRFTLIASCIIAGLILIAYSNTFTASFHFDDNPSIVENASIKRMTSDNISMLLAGVRPVVYLSLMLNYQLNGLNVVGWHVFNISFHIANSIFVYLFMFRTLNLPLLENKYREKAKRMALFGALLFAVHPIQTEAVTYIITRTELLATFFYLATFLLFIKGARTQKVSYYVGAFFTAALSMGSKEWAVTLPALLMLYDYLFIAEGKFRVVASRWMVYIAVAVPWVIVLRNLDLFAASSSGAGIGFNVATTSGITAKTYWLTSLNVIWTYIRLLFLPIKQNLDYDYRIAGTLFEFPTILSFIGHIVVVSAAFWLYKKKGWLLIPFGVAWFYIGLSPVQSFVPIIDVIFEHRAYMPSIGFFIVFVVAYEGLFEWWEARQLLKKSSRFDEEMASKTAS
ncbi:MAG: glycosyltransferase family 39 protein [Nitrospirae bacterium]|nr:glycosyltransferase family 39 protein [Nitrospirota bacterium]